MIRQGLFSSFRFKVITVIVGLLVATLAGVFYAVNSVSIDRALRQINADLDVTERAFERLVSERNRALAEKARFLSSDHAYRQIYGFGDRADLAMATENHRRRIGADLMLLLTFDGRALANTLGGSEQSPPVSIAAMLKQAMDSDTGEAREIVLIEDQLYQVVVLPLYAPDPVAMVVLGFSMGDTLAWELKEATNGTDVSFAYPREDGVFQLTACTHASALCPQLLPAGAPASGTWQTAAEPLLTRVLPLGGKGLAILQRSLDQALSGYYRLRSTLVGIFAASMLLAIFGASLLASAVTQPVATLSQGVRRIAEGDYDARVELSQRDELGQLAENFNAMAHGLAERDRVRNLLGKVVSPQIADQLVTSDITLGGEERRVTILFSDIRGFTELSERLSPQHVIAFLNDYLTGMNEVIESHQGVVDKYIGDAIMALFGAPLENPNSEQDAVNCAMAMLEKLAPINASLQAQGHPVVDIGIGIHTGDVVAGNMGSMSRLNYTVIGDAVNLASRIESLCKYYGVPLIVSGDTLSACRDLKARELDRVIVKGRSTPVTLMQPLTKQSDIDLDLHTRALDAYRARQWDVAEGLFTELYSVAEETLYALFLERVSEFSRNAPPEDWDGVTRLENK